MQQTGCGRPIALSVSVQAESVCEVLPACASLHSIERASVEWAGGKKSGKTAVVTVPTAWKGLNPHDETKGASGDKTVRRENISDGEAGNLPDAGAGCSCPSDGGLR